VVAFALLLERKWHDRKARRFEAPQEIVLVKISPALGRAVLRANQIAQFMN